MMYSSERKNKCLKISLKAISMKKLKAPQLVSLLSSMEIYEGSKNDRILYCSQNVKDFVEDEDIPISIGSDEFLVRDDLEDQE